MMDTDETLVLQAQRGNRSAFEELVRRTSRLVFARLYLETGDRHRAEDLLQETLLRAWRSLDNLTRPAKLRSWLLTIAQNALVDAARHDGRQKRTVAGKGEAKLGDVVGQGLTPDEAAARTELRERVLAVLRSLPEEYRLPLTLRYLGGADYATMETQLELSNGALRGLLHRGLKMLRQRLGPVFDDDDKKD